MMWILVLWGIFPSSFFVLANFHTSALKQENPLMTFEVPDPRSVGFRRYYVQKSPTEALQFAEVDDDVSASKTNRQQNILDRPKDTIVKQEIPPDWQTRTQNWPNILPPWQNKPTNWHRVSENELDDSKMAQRNGTGDKKQDNMPTCFDCKTKNSDSITKEEEEPLANNFIFHKVNVETSYDPFTKRPYHRTILAMKALPEGLKKHVSTTQEDQSLPHYYYMFYNISADQNVQSDQPTKSEVSRNQPTKNKVMVSSNPVTQVNKPTKRHKNQSIKKFQYKYPPPEGSHSQLADYDSEEIQFRRNNMDSLWISSYIENPKKFDTLFKQLRFLKRWVARLDRHHRRKMKRKLRKVPFHKRYQLKN